MLKSARTFLLMIVIAVLFTSTVLAQSGYNQAPELDDAVASGDLPPVAERLPDEPLVVDGVDGIGQYGGQWRRLASRPTDGANFLRIVGYEPLVRWTPDGSGVEPNVAHDWNVNDDATEYTFYLREGLKWSDGVPFTSADIMFWYEDIVLNEELTPTIPGYLVNGDQVAKVTAPDDYTVVFSFADTNGTFLRTLASPNGAALDPTFYARHYFEQYHIAYNEAEVLEQTEALGFETWVQYFVDYAGGNVFSDARWQPGLPTIGTWMLDNELSADTSVVRFSRNPYYWKVDSEGNQYPYIDDVVFTVQGDSETRLLTAAAGEVDMQFRYLLNPADRPFLFDNAEDGDYGFFQALDAGSNSVVIHLNQSSDNEVLREFFQNKDVRIALSQAIDRQEIIDLLYVGLAEPSQPAPPANSPFYNEDLAKQYTAYDVEAANQLLDEAGFAERDGDGFRLLPNGERASFVLLIMQDLDDQVEIGNLLNEYWAEIGIEALPRPVERSFFDDTTINNEHDAALWVGPGGIDIIESPRVYTPVSPDSLFGRRWYAYYAGPWTTGEEVAEDDFALRPPDNIIRQWELFDEIQRTPDQERQAELLTEMLALTVEVFPTIGISTLPPRFGIVHNSMGNVPETMINGWTYVSPSNINPFTFYKK